MKRIGQGGGLRAELDVGRKECLNEDLTDGLGENRCGKGVDMYAY